MQLRHVVLAFPMLPGMYVCHGALSSLAVSEQGHLAGSWDRNEAAFVSFAPPRIVYTQHVCQCLSYVQQAVMPGQDISVVGSKCNVLTGPITANVPYEALILSFILCSFSGNSGFSPVTCIITSHCRSLTNAMSTWAGRGHTAPSPSTSSSSAGAPATAKGVNTAVAAVAAAYHDKCKPAHDIAVHASQALSGVRAALTTYLREGDGRAQGSLPDLASLGCAELKAAGNSYRSASAAS